MKVNIVKIAAASLAISVSGLVNAGIIPFGVQDDIDITTVTNTWGWTQCYKGEYGETGITMNTLFSNCSGNYVMLAAGLWNSTTLDVAAAALYSDVTTYTPQHSTHLSNGAEWYFNGSSMGFASQGATIFQNSADVYASGLIGVNGSTAIDSTTPFRLSWNTLGGYANSPTQLTNGGRSGSYFYPENIKILYRYVFTTNAHVDIPEPSTIVTFALGIIGLALRKIKKHK